MVFHCLSPLTGEIFCSSPKSLWEPEWLSRQMWALLWSHNGGQAKALKAATDHRALMPPAHFAFFRGGLQLPYLSQLRQEEKDMQCISHWLHRMSLSLQVDPSTLTAHQWGVPWDGFSVVSTFSRWSNTFIKWSGEGINYFPRSGELTDVLYAQKRDKGELPSAVGKILVRSLALLRAAGGSFVPAAPITLAQHTEQYSTGETGIHSSTGEEKSLPWRSAVLTCKSGRRGWIYQLKVWQTHCASRRDVGGKINPIFKCKPQIVN